MKNTLETKEIKPIDLREKNKDVVFATEKNPHHKTGEEIKAHPILIKKFLDMGFASKETPVLKESKKA